MVYWKYASNNRVTQAVANTAKVVRISEKKTEEAPYAMQKSLTGRERIGWMNCWVGREKFSEWVIDLTFVTQWECNLFLCELLLTEISVPGFVWAGCLTGRSSEECEHVPGLIETRQFPARVQHHPQCDKLLSDCATHFNLMTLYNTCFPLGLANVQLVLRTCVFSNIGLVFKGAWLLCKNTCMRPNDKQEWRRQQHPLLLSLCAQIKKEA